MIGTLRRELLDRLLIVTERHPHPILTPHLSHFNACRSHRSLAQLTPAQVETGTPEPINLADDRIRRRSILDGLTGECHRAAWPTVYDANPQFSAYAEYSAPAPEVRLQRHRWSARVGADGDSRRGPAVLARR
jgi:hypothetical protein